MNKQLTSKLDLILANQKKILENEKKILGEEEKIESIEKDIKRTEIKDEKDVLSELNSLERNLKKNISSPIKKVTKRDLVKGFIGAFIGVVGHFAFSKAYDLGSSIDTFHASALYVVAFIIIVLMLYYTGFRNIQKNIILKFMPLRALVLYSVSIVTVILVYFLFGKIYFPIHIEELYRLVGASMILAVMGAGTADLIGRNE